MRYNGRGEEAVDRAAAAEELKQALNTADSITIA
jgi:hypothetical protein